MDRYEIVKLLGKGAYGRALLCRDIPDERFVVLKQVTSMGKDQLEEATREGEILAELDHPNVVAFYDSFVVTDPVEGDCLNIAMEYCDGGDLDAAIKRRRNVGKPFAELHVMRIFVQLTLALKYIHLHRILHRDIKPQNVFLTSDGCVKLGDFGVAKSLKGSVSMAHTQLGTPYYLSPEIFNDENYDDSSDMWSLGVLAFELTTLALPFQAASLGKLAVRVMRDEPPVPTCSPELQQVLGKLLTKCAKDRPSAAEVLRFPFVREHARRLLDHAAATGFGGLEEDVVEAPPSSRRGEDDAEKESQTPRSRSAEDGVGENASSPKSAASDMSETLPLQADIEEHENGTSEMFRDNDDERGLTPDDTNLYARPRSGAPSSNPYARQAKSPIVDEQSAALRIQNSWRRQASESTLVEENQEAADSPGKGEEVQAVLTIQRSWRNMTIPADEAPRRLPKRNQGALSPTHRPQLQRRGNPTKKSAKHSVKDSLARAAERGAAKRAQAEVKSREQRTKRANERGDEPMIGDECTQSTPRSARDGEDDDIENTVVIQLSEKNRRNSVERENVEQIDRVEDDETLQSIVPASWRVRGHITVAEERGRARKAQAEQKAAQLQKEIEESRGVSLNTTITRAPSRRRRNQRTRWVPELPTLAASNAQLEQQLALERQDSHIPAASGAAGRVVSAVRSARRVSGGEPSTRRDPTTRRYKTKPTSQALENQLKDMLNDH